MESDGDDCAGSQGGGGGGGGGGFWLTLAAIPFAIWGLIALISWLGQSCQRLLH